ncbi:hypothetical protein [Nocardia harenae]|uniref:hypothetical protein n=1 Tax=Nocardia harenae TaxID=358707 RepID=UPI000831AF0D|nr:hypothetical protein [Nocardia harenae]
MSAQREPEFNDPVELLDELDAVLREQELLKRRVEALGARYGALQGPAEAGRFDQWSEDKAFPEEYGSVNVKAAQQRLKYAAGSMSGPLEWVRLARDCAELVQECPQPQREQVSALTGYRETGIESAADRGRSR